MYQSILSLKGWRTVQVSTRGLRSVCRWKDKHRQQTWKRVDGEYAVDRLVGVPGLFQTQDRQCRGQEGEFEVVEIYWGG